MRHSKTELQRRSTREELLRVGIDPYPAPSFHVSATARDVETYYEEFSSKNETISIAGRLMARRVMGSATFAELQDSTGRVQIFVTRDMPCSGVGNSKYDHFFLRQLDLGDIIGVTGNVFMTKTGVRSVNALEIVLLSKSLRAIPIVKKSISSDGKPQTHDAFTDPEQRYRQRYVDLIVNPDVRDRFVKRTKIIDTIRRCVNARGYLEVETPILQPIHGGAAAKPFKTHHNALNVPLYLRIANELYLKRLIVGGFEGVYEFAKNFRNEGLSRFHNPEFTLFELYVAYKDYYWMIDLMEEIVEEIAYSVCSETRVRCGDNIIDFRRPWKRYGLYELIQNYTGYDVSKQDESQLRKTCRKLNVKIEDTMKRGKLIERIFGDCCESKLINPTVIIDYPIDISPLSKKHRSKEGLVERFEVICNGMELMNGYSELNDPVDQRLRFEDQLQLRAKGDDEAMVLDEDFVRALEYGMPPTAGVGIGIDRLTMLLTDSRSIQDVIFFPQMKPE